MKDFAGKSVLLPEARRRGLARLKCSDAKDELAIATSARMRCSTLLKSWWI